VRAVGARDRAWQMKKVLDRNNVRTRRAAQFLQQVGGNGCRKVEIKRRGIFSKTDFGGNIRTSAPSTTKPARTSDYAAV